MHTYPDYVHRMLARAREEGQGHAAQADAAALCFDVLALYPEHDEASELIHQLFCDEWMIYDNRVAIQRMIDEWDDRPWQHRRRLALSFRFMSRWEGWHREYEEGYEHERDGPADVAGIPWIPPRGDGSRYHRMMQHIDPFAPTADETIRRIRAENTRERTAPYRPSISSQLSQLFSSALPAEVEKHCQPS